MAHVKKCVLENRINFVCEVIDVLGISDWSVLSILNDSLKMHQIATKFMPQLLSEEQKENHISTSQDLQGPTMLFSDKHR
jgi:hypothetical protein